MSGSVKSALVIAGHGSHLSHQTAAPAWQHADAIRELGIFDEVTCAFWKESPSLHRVLDTLTADDITIVPLFTAEGYFSSTVLPAELGLNGAISQRDGRTLRYTDTVGQHPHMTGVILDRANAVVNAYQLDPLRTALAIAGHGTKRDPGSAKAARQQAETIAAMGKFAEVLSIYMDEPPEIEHVYEITQSQSIVIVPFFVADGSHTQEDIPVDLGITPDPRRVPYSVPSRVADRDVYYTSAVGMEPSVANVLIELAQAAGAPLKPPQPQTDPWGHFPTAGLQALRELDYPFAFGQIVVERIESGFRIQPANAPEPTDRIDTPAALRQRLSRDAYGNFRALRTGIDLPGGWYVEVNSVEALLAVLETIYPTAWIDMVQQRAGHLPLQTVEQVAARQTGMYKRVGTLSTDQLPLLVMAHCGLCVRTPTWFNGDQSSDRIPCPEPCQCWMSFALQQVEASAEVSHKVSQILGLSESDLESVKEALRSAIAHTEPDVRPAEYTDPRNPARLRALLARLDSITRNNPE